MATADSNLEHEFEFFASRGTVKKPRKKRLTVKPLTSVAEPATRRRRRRGVGSAYQHTNTGRRADLGELVPRSSWESNVLRVLYLHKVPFEFETRTFMFPPDARGRLSAYLPDIYLPKTDEYIEVKGMLDSRGRNKLRKFKKNYPEEFSRLTMIISKSNKDNKIFCAKLGVPKVLYYENLSKLYKPLLEAWEGR